MVKVKFGTGHPKVVIPPGWPSSDPIRAPLLDTWPVALQSLPLEPSCPQVFFAALGCWTKNRGFPPKWMVYNGKPYKNGWFGGTPIFWKHLLYLFWKSARLDSFKGFQPMGFGDQGSMNMAFDLDWYHRWGSFVFENVFFLSWEQPGQESEPNKDHPMSQARDMACCHLLHWISRPMRMIESPHHLHWMGNIDKSIDLVFVGHSNFSKEKLAHKKALSIHPRKRTIQLACFKFEPQNSLLFWWAGESGAPNSSWLLGKCSKRTGPSDMPLIGSPSTVLSTCKLATGSFQVSRAVADILRTGHTKPWGSHTHDQLKQWQNDDCPRSLVSTGVLRRHIDRPRVIPTLAGQNAILYWLIVKVPSLG